MSSKEFKKKYAELTKSSISSQIADKRNEIMNALDVEGEGGQKIRGTEVYRIISRIIGVEMMDLLRDGEAKSAVLKLVDDIGWRRGRYDNM